MNSTTLYHYLKLGMNIEYLRGASSVSVMPADSLVAFPRLVANLPPNRYPVIKVVEVIKALLVQLEDLGLSQTLAEAQQFRPLLEQMEAYLGQTADSSASFMNDSFADKLVFFANELQLALKKEASAKRVAEIPPHTESIPD
jgi:hypothetical protein